MRDATHVSLLIFFISNELIESKKTLRIHKTLLLKQTK